MIVKKLRVFIFCQDKIEKLMLVAFLIFTPLQNMPVSLHQQVSSSSIATSYGLLLESGVLRSWPETQKNLKAQFEVLITYTRLLQVSLSLNPPQNLYQRQASSNMIEAVLTSQPDLTSMFGFDLGKKNWLPLYPYGYWIMRELLELVNSQSAKHYSFLCMISLPALVEALEATKDFLGNCTSVEDFQVSDYKLDDVFQAVKSELIRKNISAKN